MKKEDFFSSLKEQMQKKRRSAEPERQKKVTEETLHSLDTSIKLLQEREFQRIARLTAQDPSVAAQALQKYINIFPSNQIPIEELGKIRQLQFWIYYHQKNSAACSKIAIELLLKYPKYRTRENYQLLDEILNVAKDQGKAAKFLGKLVLNLWTVNDEAGIKYLRYHSTEAFALIPETQELFTLLYVRLDKLKRFDEKETYKRLEQAYLRTIEGIKKLTLSSLQKHSILNSSEPLTINTIVEQEINSIFLILIKELKEKLSPTDFKIELDALIKLFGIEFLEYQSKDLKGTLLYHAIENTCSIEIIICILEKGFDRERQKDALTLWESKKLNILGYQKVDKLLSEKATVTIKKSFTS